MAMSLKKTPPGKAGPASLPYDVFLNIIDILITEAQVCKNAMMWQLFYNHDAATRLVVWEGPKCPAAPAQDPVQWSRHFNTRLPAQINRMTRSMVHRKFVRVPRTCHFADDGTSNDELPRIDAWVRPELDYFIPFFSDHDESRFEEELHFIQAMLLPTPQADVLTRSITQIVTPGRCFWCETNAPGVAALSTLPNLKEAYMDIGRFNPPEKLPKFDGRLVRIDPNIFLDLRIWSITHGAAFRNLYKPLRKRGIRLYGYANDVYNPVVEVVGTKRGIRVRYTHNRSGCNCCCDPNMPPH
ncbi:hypothetical protein CkaCkLH20_08935 [Colletotrichum karsti]|uniref:Uncharacterized protein n=1 Tax=Colletotrichum karsti TaxID=1095194 RepID=A0A9P6I217_9PEZI|nr:uncharacterized protein CkaCkLH20_08935 [Colletotrichum karsti]KAF9873476.1 hypothetical protein CkaCkLH20_08935 [Colletotrichum karsti]